jgi:hypothetical protein
MQKYRITFFKDLLSSDGHQFRCPQRTIEIRRSKTDDRAIAAAKRRYQRLTKMCDWKCRADWFEVEKVGQPGD